MNHKNIMKEKALIFIFILALISLVKADYGLDEKFYFQLYPSIHPDQSYLFHVYTPQSTFITINTTEEQVCKVLGTENVNENVKIDLSSVIKFNDTLLIKTCFGPDKIVEIINEKNEAFFYKKINLADGTQGNLNNIKYCYSTTIFNPLVANELIIFTYWTEFSIYQNKEKYTHKCILFYPKTHRFSQELTFDTKANIIEYLINYNYYPKSCVTFQGVDIYCSIYFDSDDGSYANSFSIDTRKLWTERAIHLIFSNKDYKNNIYQKPISLNKQIHDSYGGYFDVFLTEYHDEEKNKIMLISSLYRKSLQLSLISLSDKNQEYYGINIEDDFVDPNLFNHLLPNQKDLIIIYIMKTGTDNSLIMTRFNLTDSQTYHKKFKEYSLSNYLRDDICSKPKYIQSIFVNSFINYTPKDVLYINGHTSEKFYKYQKDIVTFIACEDDQNKVFYEPKKVIV